MKIKHLPLNLKKREGYLDYKPRQSGKEAMLPPQIRRSFGMVVEWM